MALETVAIAHNTYVDSHIYYRVKIILPSSLQSYCSLKYTDGKDYWIKSSVTGTKNGNTYNINSRTYTADTSAPQPYPPKVSLDSSHTAYPARFYYTGGNLYLDITENSIEWGYLLGWRKVDPPNNWLNWSSFTISGFSLADLITVKTGYTVSPSLSNVSIGTVSVTYQSTVNYTISGITPYKSVSTNKVLAFPSKEYYSFKSGINDLVKNNFSFQYTSGGSTTTLNSSYITVSDVSGSQYNKAVTITQNISYPASTIDTDFANGVLVPNTGVKLSTFYSTVAYNMASLNVAVTLTKSGNTFTVNSLPDPIWQYISSFALNVPVQAGGFSGTCTAFAQTGPFVNNYTVSYSGTITTWNQSVTSSMNQICSISYSYQVSGNNTSSSKTFTVDRYYGYVTSSTHLRMGVNFTGSSSLLYQSTAPTVEQLSSTSEIRSVTRL